MEVLGDDYSLGELLDSLNKDLKGIENTTRKFLPNIMEYFKLAYIRNSEVVESVFDDEIVKQAKSEASNKQDLSESIQKRRIATRLYTNNKDYIKVIFRSSHDKLKNM